MPALRHRPLNAPPFIASLFIGELFFNFGSFLIETLSFLALWCLLSVTYSTLMFLTKGHPNEHG